VKWPPAKEQLVERCQLIGSSAQEAVKIGTESVKMKNLLCSNPLPGNG
jgi:hypothetical protein